VARVPRTRGRRVSQHWPATSLTEVEARRRIGSRYSTFVLGRCARQCGRNQDVLGRK
jgi:hypothetical protein